MKNKFSLSLLLGFCAINGMAQVQTRFFTAQEVTRFGIKNFPTSIAKFTHKTMPEFDFNLSDRQDSIDNAKGVGGSRYGKVNSVNIDLLSEGSMHKIGDSTYLIYQVYSKGAKSINLIFNHFRLDAKTSMVIYNADRTTLYGPVTNKQNQASGTFWTDIIKGEKLIVQLSTLGNFSKDNNLKVSGIIHGLRGVEKSGVYTHGGSQICEVDTKCSDGIGWHDVDQSIAMILYIDQTGQWARHCSGSLINNTSQNFVPYFLTAFHCLDTDKSTTLSAAEKTAPTDWAFRFFYVATTCGSNVESPYVTYNGASFKAAYQVSDFALLLLNQHPNAINYAGWSRSTSPSVGASIHHPTGDLKKISKNDLVSNRSTNLLFTDGSIALANKFWEAHWSVGVMEGGSSGAPLFNSNRQIIGQEKGGLSICQSSSNRFDLFGRFDVSWVGGGTDETGLKHWLDPGNMDLPSIDFVCAGFSGPSLVCTDGTYSPNNPGVNWFTSNPSGLSIVNGVATRQNNFNGYVTITASQTVGCAVSKTVYVGGPGPLGTVSGETQPSVGGIYQYICSTPSQGALYYDWILPYSGSPVWSQYGGSQGGPIDTLTPNFIVGSSSGWVQIVAYNGCTPSPVSKLRVFPTGGGGGGIQLKIKAYPNPAQKELIIEEFSSSTNITNSAADNLLVSREETIAEDFSARLLNVSNLEVKSSTSKNGKITFDVQDLRNGFYYLLIQKGDELTTQQIQIKK